MTERDKIIEAMARAMMDVTARQPSSSESFAEYPVLALDSDYDDLPRDHTEGTCDDELTQEAVLQLATAALTAIADQGYAVVSLNDIESAKAALHVVGALYDSELTDIARP